MSQLLTRAPLHYPSAREWMWDYCIYLGPYTCPEGRNYDLGIYMGLHNEVSAAIVCGNEPGEYYSGKLLEFGYAFQRPYYLETIKRAKALGLIKGAAGL